MYTLVKQTVGIKTKLVQLGFLGELGTEIEERTFRKTKMETVKRIFFLSLSSHQN